MSELDNLIKNKYIKDIEHFSDALVEKIKEKISDIGAEKMWDIQYVISVCRTIDEGYKELKGE